MSLSKKILSVLLAVITVFSALSLTAFAQEPEIKIIDEVNVTIDFDDLVNQPTADFGERISVEQEGLRFGSVTVTQAGSTFLTTETFEPGKKYWFSLCYYVEDGYNIEGYTYQQGYSGDIPVSINGEELEHFYKFDKSPLQFYDKTCCVYPQHYTENGDQRICLFYSFEIPELNFFEKIIKAIEDFFASISEFFSGMFSF